MNKNYIPLCPCTVQKNELMQMNPVVLAFVGDGVQTLYVRTKLSLSHTGKSGALHLLATQELKATAQAEAAKRIQDFLTEEETAVYKRGRNGKTPSVAKNASINAYHCATGLESLFGYLYLLGETARLEEVMEIAFPRELFE